MDNRKERQQRDQQLKDLQVINEKRRQQREQLEQERFIEREYKKEMYMFHKGLIDAPPDSLGKRLSAIQSTLDQDENTEKKDDILEYRAVVKGKV